jgi:hypothetical protein
MAVQLPLWCRRYANSGKPLSAFNQRTDSGGPSDLTLGELHGIEISGSGLLYGVNERN